MDQRYVKNQMADVLDRLTPLFQDGVLLTVIARHPTNVEASMVVTTDTLKGIRFALDHVKQGEDV